MFPNKGQLYVLSNIGQLYVFLNVSVSISALVLSRHDIGGEGNIRRLSFLGDSVVVVAPNGYQRSWNV